MLKHCLRDKTFLGRFCRSSYHEPMVMKKSRGSQPSAGPDVGGVSPQRRLASRVNRARRSACRPVRRQDFERNWRSSGTSRPDDIAHSPDPLGADLVMRDGLANPWNANLENGPLHRDHVMLPRIGAPHKERQGKG